MNISHNTSKGFTKQLEYVKQQQQLREITCLKNKSQSKILSADSMIEDLLSKKETFQKQNPESQQEQKQEAAQPQWLRVPPSLFEQVWHGVKAANGLADTPILSSVLLTSGLPTDTLGYIWSLANHTVPGALTQTEVYQVLALVGLAQAGYVVSSLNGLHQVPQAPLPNLDLTRLPTWQPQAYPNTLNVTSLPDTMSFNWTSYTTNTSCTGPVGVSYVSSGPMISANLISDKTKVSNISDPNNASNSIPSHNNGVCNNLKMNMGLCSKNNSDIKRTDNPHCFSFPKLNESPSHMINVRQESTDSFEDEFTDFQSADFSSISESQKPQSNLNSTTDDEFTNFQKASPNYNSDDLSVLVVGGKSTPATQQLWVTDSPSISLKKAKKRDKTPNLIVEDRLHKKHQADTNKVKNNTGIKCASFEVIDDDKYSVFHNPLEDDDCKPYTQSSRPTAVDDMQMETKSIFNHSLFQDPEPSLDLFQIGRTTQNTILPNIDPDQVSNKVDEHEEEDDEYSHFQDCPISFPNSDSGIASNNVDKYDVFRTIIFEDICSPENGFQTTNSNNIESIPQTQSFELDMSESSNEKQHGIFSNCSETKSVEFDDFQKSATLPSDKFSNNSEAKSVEFDDFQKSPTIPSDKFSNNSEAKSVEFDDFQKSLTIPSDKFSNNSEAKSVEFDDFQKSPAIPSDKFSNNSEAKSVEFDNFQKSVKLPSDNSTINSLFSSMAISDKKDDYHSDTSSSVGPLEDKYNALRLLEPSVVEFDDFGEFLGAIPNSGNDPRKFNDLSTVQIRCLEACLTLLKDGVSKMSQFSTTEMVSEVLNDSRTSEYLDCLLEVHKVSQRIISQLNSDLCVTIVAELRDSWDKLVSYYKHLEHNHMEEVVGAVCGVCRSNTGPSPVTFGNQTFHTPCANLYLHCVEPVLPNIVAPLVQ